MNFNNNFWVKRGILLLLAYVLYLWSWQQAFGSEATPQVSIVRLNGHLDAEKFAGLFSLLNTPAEASQPLILIVNSSSGNLMDVLDAAKKIYEFKIQKKLPLVVYIHDNAVGPAAVLPFLADKLYTSLFVSWGDIPLGNDKVLPANILRSRVTSLIGPTSPQADVLQALAAAMSDPAVRLTNLTNGHGWRIVKEGETSISGLSSSGQTLVINHHQLKELGLVQDVLNLENFLAAYKQGAMASDIQLTLAGEPVGKVRLDEELTKHIHIKPEQNLIGHIVIDDHTSGISQATWIYVKKALEEYRQLKPAFIILELNTPGGEVLAAQQISDALKDMDTQFGIPVVAYINNWAISAGAMLAYSSRFIATVKDGSMGAAEPVIQGQEGTMVAASEKINSALRADFSNRARFFDRDPSVAEAMVDKDLILVRRHGKLIKLDNEAQINTTGIDPDIVISPKGKLLTLNAQQMLDFGVADFLVLPAKTEPITAAEREAGKWPASKMSLFQLPFFKDIPHAIISSYQMDWKTRFFALLATPMVSSLLFLGLMLGAYMEFNTPGFGVPGTIALTCLFLIALSSYSLEIVNWLEVILLLVGLAIILVELFVLPTFGLLGFIGLAFFLMGLFGMMLPGVEQVDYEFDTNSFNAAGQAFFERLVWLCGTLVVAFIAMAIIARYVTPSMAKFSRLVLNGNEQDASEGYIAGDNPKELPQPGSKGEVFATLRPAGKVVINDIIYDAISDGNFIERGTSVVVEKLDGSVIVVKPDQNARM